MAKRIRVISKRKGLVALASKPKKNAQGMVASTPLTIKSGVNWWEGDTAMLKDALSYGLGAELVRRGEIYADWDNVANLDTNQPHEADHSIKAIKKRFEAVAQKATNRAVKAEKLLVAKVAKIAELEAKIERLTSDSGEPEPESESGDDSDAKKAPDVKTKPASKAKAKAKE